MMNEKITIEQQVAQLTPQQKKNIRIYEIVSGSIGFLCIVPLFIYLSIKYFAYINTSIMSPMYEIAKSEFNFALIVFGSVLVVFGIVFAIFFFTVVKKKMPYYSMKKAAYLLTHFKA